MQKLFFLFILWCMCQAASAQYPIDSSFANNGTKRIHIAYTDQAIKVALTNNNQLMVLASVGNIGAGGVFDNNAALVRLTQNGEIDTTFGTNNGSTIFDFGNFIISEPKDMLITPDQMIWVLGQARQPDSIEYQPFCVAKFNPNGTPDTTFGNHGCVIFNFLGGTEMPARMCQQTNGKVLVWGYTLASNAGVHQDQTAIARLNANGTLDTTFGTTGKVVFDFSDNILIYPNRYATDTTTHQRHGYGGFFSDAIVLPNNKILCAGGYNNGLNYQGLVMQLLPNGTFDTTYAVNGLRGISVDEGNNHYINKLLARPDGSVLAGLHINSQVMPRDFYLLTLDSLCQAPSINDSYDFNNNFDFIEDMIWQANTKLLCLGRSIKPINYQTGYLSDYYALCRLNPNQTALDTTFAQQGKWLFAADTTRQNIAASLVLQNNEKIVILGTVFNPSSSNRSDLLLVRLNNPIATQTIKPQTASFALYPNPSAQSFVVDNPNTQNTTFYLYNTQGNLVLQQNLPLGTNYINISYLPNGVYVAKMISNTAYWATKVVKID